MEDKREKATKPEELARFFVERANAKDAEGISALYEDGAVFAFPSGDTVVGREGIRAAFEGFLADAPHFEAAGQFPALVSGDLALTSTRLPDGSVTVEVARRQPDGTWLWVIDKSNALAS